MKARTKRRITEAIISLFCLAVLVFTFRIFVIPASRGEKVRFRFIWFDPDTMAEHEPAMDGAPASFPPPHTATRTMPGASGDAAPRGRSSGLPAILAGLKLPDDPEDLPKVLLPRNISLFRVLRRACPGDNEWVASGLDALERHARSDTAVRKELSTVYGPRLLSGRLCPDDRGRFEAFLRTQLQSVYWDKGRVADSVPPGAYVLFSYLSFSQDPATQRLFRDIALDGDAAHDWRDLAARTMVDQRYGKMPDSEDPRYRRAVKSVLVELAGADPRLVELESYYLRWLDMILEAEDPFHAEYGKALEAVGRDARPVRVAAGLSPLPENCADFTPAEQFTASSSVSEMMDRYRPDRTKRRGVTGTTVLRLSVDIVGRVTDQEITKTSGHPGLDTASVWTAHWIRFTPATRCGNPVESEFAYTLTWYEWREW